MEINITGKNLKITKSIRDYINKKITKVIDDFEQPVNCDVILEVEKNRHITEIILSGDTGRFYLKKSANDLYKSIDSVVQSADISVKKFKERQKDRDRKTKIRKEVKKKKKITGRINLKKLRIENIKPMTIEEAILQLRYLKQDILLFRNAKNFNTYILFKNRGIYSLIQPKISFLPKLLFSKFKKNKYNVLLLRYKNKIDKIQRKKVPLNVMSYKSALESIYKTRNLNYLIFENDSNGKVTLLFRISKNLIGDYEFK